MDLIVTVSNSAASETCPVWSGAPLSVHWRITDPTEFGPSSQREAFAIGFQALRARIGAFLSLPIESLDSPDLKARLQAIGKMEQPAG
jgi:arsenate reductase